MESAWKSLTEGFMPHGFCIRWDPALLFVFIIGNIGIAIAYFLIPAALRHFVGKRKDLPYPHMWRLFAAFILSCGLTHLMKVWTFYQPLYWMEAVIDLWTAGVSLATAFLLLPLIPEALKLRSPAELDASNRQLRQVTEELRAAKGSLEVEVAERTAELLAATKKAQEAEVFFRQLFDLMPQLGWTARSDGFIEFYNRGWYEYTGTNFEQMKGWGWEQVHDPEILPRVKEQWSAALHNGTQLEMKFPLRGADGNFQWFLTRVNPVFDEQGRVIRWVGINMNIQQQIDQSSMLERLVEDRTSELKAAKELAEHALETKGRFLATVSHEVRTPLAGIIGLAELLTLQDLGDENNTTAIAIFDSSKRLLQILNDVLDTSKLGAGKLSLDTRNISICSIMDDVARLLKPDADKKRLALSVHCDESIPETVQGDELRLRQIVLNLGFNAIKFTDSGTIHLSAQRQADSGDKVVIRFTVKDSGIGISRDRHLQVFEPFEQEKQSTSQIYGGTGLGLSISKSLVELMGGSIGIDSDSGKGSTFWFDIPFQRGEAQSS